jgi:hypothetical protein
MIHHNSTNYWSFVKASRPEASIALINRYKTPFILTLSQHCPNE